VLTQRYSVDPQRVRVIPGGVDIDRFETAMTRQEARQKLGWDLDRPTVLCVRRLVHRMGLEQLIEAMIEVRRGRPDVKLVIAGKGPLAPTLTDIVQQRGLSESVQLLGFVPDDDLPTAYRAADLSIVPSQSLEGFGLIIPESLAAGTPAMVTPIGGMPEIVRDLDPNLILSGPSVGELQEGLLQAFDGLERLPTAADCKAHASQRFGWSAIGKRILSVYAEAMEAYA
jgi:glycosyltransferase involved in cell wall biosynthesis